ncbi:MAG: PQQ-binding-like beta-propeller repeat protein [Candidatus Brocadiia bacterium]|nr:PQQ-binding-like beta-propeller repeat protein [Candidatus Brocadiia bacterium]
MSVNEAQTSQDAAHAGRQVAAVRERRLLALSLLLVAAMFSGVVMGIMVGTHLSEPPDPPDYASLENMRALFKQMPGNAELKERIRAEDARARQVYFNHRRRLRAGAWLLLVGLAAVVVCARWYVSIDPKVPVPGSPSERTDTRRWLPARRREIAALGVVAGGLVAAALVIGLAGGADFPRSNLIKATEEPARPPVVEEQFEQNWPGFRGPTGMGLAKEDDWPWSWDAGSGENILWKTPVPAPGKSSPVLWGNRIFLTGGDAQTREVFCFRRSTGELLWRKPVPSMAEASAGEDDELDVMEDTGYAAPTPVTDGKRVYAFFATGDLAAIDFGGNVVWARNLGKPENIYGIATSPVLCDGKLIVQFDRGGAEEGLSELLALDPQTGRTLWSTPRPVPSSWATPVVAQTAGRAQLITCATPWMIAYDPASGEELWRAGGLMEDVAASPVVAGDLAFASNPYAQVTAVRTDGGGDVTETHVVWAAQEGMSDAASPVCDGKLFLQVDSRGLITCYGAGRGEPKWDERIDCAFWASPTLVGSTVYLPGQNGKTYIFQLAEEFELAGAANLGEPIYATPAFADSRIYIRGDKHLFCIGKETP